jgi:asparagine N-glycosylation enzyme membrane subunit Stt3
VVLRGRAAAPALLLLGWAGIVYAFHAGAAYQNFRFTLAYLPPLAILAAIGAQAVLHRLRRPGTAAIAAGVFAVGLALMVAGGVHVTRALIGSKQRSLDVVAWTEARTPLESVLVTFDLTSTFRRYGRLPTLELYEQDSARLTSLLAAPAPVYLLVDRAKMEAQWAELPPGRNVRWLEGNPGLTRHGETHGFTLYRVGANAAGTGAEH